MSNKIKKVFLEYKQRDKTTGEEKWIDGYFELINSDGQRITIKTNKGALVTLPDHRWYIMKDEA